MLMKSIKVDAGVYVLTLYPKMSEFFVSKIRGS